MPSNSLIYILSCRDGLFTIKALLNSQRNHDLATHVGFVDLVKAYDTANHALLLRILERYGAPSKLVAAIQTIYTNNICVLKIEKETVEIPQSVGVRQGDNMAPVLFLFLVTAFAETLEIVWKQQEIPVVSVMTATGENKINEKIDRHGFLRSWIHEASNENYWNQLVDRLLHPDTPIPERPADWGPLPSWQARRATNRPTPNGDTSESDDKTTKDNEE